MEQKIKKILDNNDFLLRNIISKNIGGEVGDIIDKYSNTTKSSLSDLMEFVDVFDKWCHCIENYDKINDKLYMKLNTIAPKRWQNRYQAIVIDEAFKKIDIDKSKENEIIALTEKLIEFSNKNPEILNFIINHGVEQFTDILNNGADKIMEKIGEYSDEEIEELTTFFPIKIQEGIRLYHGTSYDNYLEILKSGFIKASNYLEGNNYPNDVIEKVYHKESGFVFLEDTLDLPLAFSMGGYRKNVIPWAYVEEKITNNESNEPENNKNDINYHDYIGVIFEVDPTNYNVFFLTTKEEFIIEGDIDINDTKPIFYFWNPKIGNIKLTTEEELRKEGYIE